MFVPFGDSLLNTDLVDCFEFVAMRESKTGGGAVKLASLSASQVPEVIQGSPDQVSNNLSRLFAGRLDGDYLKPYLQCRAFTQSKAVYTDNLDEMRQLLGA